MGPGVLRPAVARVVEHRRRRRRAGTQRLGHVLAQLGETPPAAGRASAGRRLDDALARQMRRQWLAGGPLAGEARHGRRPGRGHLGGDLVLAGAGPQLLQLQLELLDQAPGALRPGSEQLSLELGDLQLQMRDLSLGFGGGGAGGGQLGRGIIPLLRRLARQGARGDQRRLQRVNVLRQGVGGSSHAPD